MMINLNTNAIAEKRFSDKNKLIRYKKDMLARRGIEPVTFALLARRSNQLS